MNIDIKDRQGKYPTYKARFIANLSSSITTELSKLLTSCLSTVKTLSYCTVKRFMKGQVKISFGSLKIMVGNQLIEFERFPSVQFVSL